MTIEPTQEQAQFIQQEIAAGVYDDEAAFLEDAVALMQKRKAFIAKVQAGAKQGREDIAAGNYFEVNSAEDAQTLREEIHRRAKELRAKREQSTH